MRASHTLIKPRIVLPVGSICRHPREVPDGGRHLAAVELQDSVTECLSRSFANCQDHDLYD